MQQIPDVIHILGASGSGTSTLGQAISNKFGHTWLDSDDFFWLPTNPPFIEKRDKKQRQELLKAILENKKCVISGSLCKWGDPFIKYFDFVIFLQTPTKVRLERIKKREFQRFGERINKFGDMYKNHQEFLEWASKYDTAGPEMRSLAMHEHWLKQLPCKVMKANGELPPEEIIESIFKF